VVRSGAYTADSAIIPPEWNGAIAGYDMVVSVTRASPRFIAYSLLSKYVLDDQLLLMTLRAAQPHLNAGELGSIRIIAPTSIQEQNRICDYLDEKLSELEQIKDNINQQINTLRDYRKSLIHECVTGKRRITAADVQEVQEVQAHV
jgi:type I restriction enzyme S subunit